MSILFLNNTWDHWTDRSESYFSCYTYFSHRNAEVFRWNRKIPNFRNTIITVKTFLSSNIFN